MEGPRPPYEDEMPALGRLVDATFMEGRENAMFDRFPALFGAWNRDNLLVCAEGGRIVSHVGQTQRWACLGGCSVRVACLGAVATEEASRGRGVASRLFAAACAKAAAEGVDFMLISGDRTLYRRAGAVAVGREAMVKVDRELAAPLASDEFEVCHLREEDFPACQAAYDARRARFIRSNDEWARFFSSPWCGGRPAEWRVVKRRGRFVAYIVLRPPATAGEACHLPEWAGDPVAVAGALASLIEECGASHVIWPLQQEDHGVEAWLRDIGAPIESTPAGGTLLVINAAQLLARLMPWHEQRLGQTAARSLAWSCNGANAVLRAPGAEIHLEGAAILAQALFGGPEAPVIEGAWAGALPIPTLRYGMNYV